MSMLGSADVITSCQCAILLSLALPIAWAGSACDEAPGFWDMNNFWQSTDEQCQLKDLTGLPSPPILQSAPGAVRVLMFGDSNDRYVAHDQCLTEETHAHSLTTLKHCVHEYLSVSWQAMVNLQAFLYSVCRLEVARGGHAHVSEISEQVGLHPQGPWYGGETGSPQERLEHGFGQHRATFENSQLDVVTFASSLWDLHRWATYQPEALAGGQIHAAVLQEWSIHLDYSLAFVEDRVPNSTLLIFRTGASGDWWQCQVPSLQSVGVTKSHMYQLNAMARSIVRRRPRWKLLDVEQMVEQFECPSSYLRDIIHLKPRVTWTVLNRYLNMLHTFWEERGLPDWRQTSTASS